MFSKAVLLSLALPAAYAAVHESISALPHGWTESTSAVAEDQSMTLSVALQYSNLASLEKRLLNVADPDSEDYGKWLEAEEVNKIFAPSSKHARRVKSWLHKSGATDIKTEGAMISFHTTVGAANKLLDTEFKLYTNGKTTHLRTTQYSIPDDLVDAIDLVSPTTYFSAGPSKQSIRFHANEVAKVADRTEEAAAISTACGLPLKNAPLGFLVTPKCVKELYSVGDYTPEVSSGSTVAFGNFLNESASYSDLAKFQKNQSLTVQNFTVLALIRGGFQNELPINDQNPATEIDGEANLDVQNIDGVVNPLPISAYLTGGNAPFVPDLLQPNSSVASNEPYLQYYTYLLAQPTKKVPWVISNSYGDHENTVPEKYAKRVCSMIGMMGMRGHTIIESSGDEGVGAVCRQNTGAKKPEFTPQFPGTCPYVLAVGGTAGFPDKRSWVGSSGGFSNYFATPSYQTDAVDTYLTKYIPQSVKKYYESGPYTNFSGRGFPDVAALSVNPYYFNVDDGQLAGNGGTSAAAPVWAGIVTLLNDARLRNKQSTLGFMNPFLYKNAKALNDVVHGGSIGCNGRNTQTGQKIPGAGIIPYATWNATTGWDPATGLGTPNFEKLKPLVLAASKYT